MTGGTPSSLTAARASAASARADRWWAIQAKAAPYLFISPFFILFAAFMLYPLGRSVMLSLYKTAGPRAYRFVGLEHYLFFLRDRLFWLAVANTVAYAIALVSIQIPASLGLAILLNQKAVRLRNVFRFAFFSPHLVGNVFVAVIFYVLLAQRHGLMAKALGALHGPWAEIGWLANPVWARVAVVIATLWLSIGYGMVYFLAALQGVDKELYEAAEVDGAGPASRFWHVTLPGIRPVLIFMILIGTIGSFQLFELPYVLFQGSGPSWAGLTVVMYLFQNGFDAGDMGAASAIGWMLMVMILGVTLVQVRLSRATREDGR